MHSKDIISIFYFLWFSFLFQNLLSCSFSSTIGSSIYQNIMRRSKRLISKIDDKCIKTIQNQLNKKQTLNSISNTDNEKNSDAYQKSFILPPAEHILLDLGELFEATIISRPSKSIKSPYVADVIIKGTQETALAHAPSLDCAGMVIGNSTVLCLENKLNSGSKTKYSIQLCQDILENSDTTVSIGYHPALAEKLAEILIQKKILSHVFNDTNIPYSSFAKQVTIGKFRFDFLLNYNENANVVSLIETKNVVCADYPKNSISGSRSHTYVYESALLKDDPLYKRTALFPVGSKKAGIGVVSDRAIKHIHELTNLHGQMYQDDKKIQSCVLFIINRSDCDAFRPCHEADMLFAQMLYRASLVGVRLIAQEVIWKQNTDTNSYYALLGRILPVTFDCTVRSSTINESHLQKVLEYNADNSKVRNSPKKADKKQS